MILISTELTIDLNFDHSGRRMTDVIIRCTTLQSGTVEFSEKNRHFMDINVIVINKYKASG